MRTPVQMAGMRELEEAEAPGIDWGWGMEPAIPGSVAVRAPREVRPVLSIGVFTTRLKLGKLRLHGVLLCARSLGKKDRGGSGNGRYRGTGDGVLRGLGVLYFLHLFSDSGLEAFGVFRAVTFRAAFAALFAFIMCVTLGPHVIAWLRQRKYGENTQKSDSEFIAQKHAAKSGTPTMGGVILVASTLCAVALFARSDVVFVPLAFFTMLALALVGFYDDWIKLTRKEKGLTIREKLCFQAVVGLGVGYLLYAYSPSGARGAVAVPFVEAAFWPTLGYGYLIWAGVVLTASSNAVNLTDGLDGLATLCTITVAVAFGLMAYFSGHAGMAQHLAVPRVPGAEELAVICAALAGACLGFLWFNAHPAEVFMGDTGSLALGGLVGLVALSIKQELMLVLVGGVFVAEALSVLIQIASFRWFGRRVFRIAPLHHHFEKVGWPETKIVSRFFIVSVLLAVFSIATLRV
ncbi:MAG: hypothetical protein AMXMBFR7_03440 [Planctomycetota bacterium]